MGDEPVFRCGFCDSLLLGAPLSAWMLLSPQPRPERPVCPVCGTADQLTPAWKAYKDWQAQQLPPGYTSTLVLPIKAVEERIGYCGVGQGRWAVIRPYLADFRVWGGPLEEVEESFDDSGDDAPTYAEIVSMVRKLRRIVGDPLPGEGAFSVLDSVMVRPLPSSRTIEAWRSGLGLNVTDALSRALIRLLGAQEEQGHG